MSKTCVRKIKEYWDLEQVERIRGILPPDHRDAATLAYVMEENTEGMVETEYFNGKLTKDMRIYSAKSYQNMTKWIMAACAKKYYLDYDGVNMYPNILRQVLAKQGIRCLALDKYCADREQIIADILSTHRGLDRKAVKTAFIIIIHNGDYKQQTNGETVLQLERLTREMRSSLYRLSETDQWKQMFKDIKKLEEKTNKLGTFASYVNQTVERLVMDSFVSPEILEVSPDRFDGKLVPREYALDLEECTQRVLARTGYDIQFVASELESREPRPVLMLPSESKVVLFDVDGTLLLYHGSTYKYRPGAERLKELEDHGYRLGLYTNKSADNLPWGDIMEELEVKWDYVFTGEVCYKPSEKYARNNKLDKYDEIKPLAPFFKDLNQVLIVDDTLGKIHHTERHRAIHIPTWDGLDTNCDLHQVIDDLLGDGFKDRIHPFELHESALGKWRPGTTIQEFGPEVNRVLPIEWTTRVQVRAAGMGLGKTYQAINAADEVEKECQATLGLPARILILSCRRTLATFFQGKFNNAVHYTDRNWKSADVLIFQIESLHKLVEVEAFDLMVIDEVRGVVGSLTSVHTNRKHLGVNFEVFRAIALATPKVLIMDADVEADGASVHLLNMIFSPEEITFHRYTHVSLPSIMQLMTNEDEFIKLITAKLEAPTEIRDEHGNLKPENKTVAVACNSRKDALKLAEVFKDKVSTAIITSQTDDKHIKAVGLDMNTVVAAHKLFIFTSTITQGVDCTEPIDNLFFIARRHGGACARDVLQMGGRFRDKKTMTVYCLVSPTPADPKPRAYEQALEHLASGKSSVQENINILKLREVQLLDKHIRYAPTLFCQLFAYTEAERLRNIKFELTRLAERKGYRVLKEQQVKGKLSKEMSDSNVVVETNELEYRRKVFEEMKDFSKANLIDIKEFAGTMMTNQTASRQDRVGLTVAAIKLHYPPELDFDAFELALKYREQIKNLAMIQRADEKKLVRQDSQSVASAPYADLSYVTKFTLMVDSFKECFKLLGLRDVLDTETQFESKAMETPEFKARVQQIPVEIRDRGKKSIRAAFVAKLKAAFGVGLSGQKNHRTKAADQVYRLQVDDKLLNLSKQSDYFTDNDLKNIKELDAKEVNLRERRKRKAPAPVKAPAPKKIKGDDFLKGMCPAALSLNLQQHFKSAACIRTPSCLERFANKGLV